MHFLITKVALCVRVCTSRGEQLESSAPYCALAGKQNTDHQQGIATELPLDTPLSHFCPKCKFIKEKGLFKENWKG